MMFIGRPSRPSKAPLRHESLGNLQPFYFAHSLCMASTLNFTSWSKVPVPASATMSSHPEGRIKKTRKNKQRVHTSCHLRNFSEASISHSTFIANKIQNLDPQPHLAARETGKCHLYSVLSFFQL